MHYSYLTMLLCGHFARLLSLHRLLINSIPRLLAGSVICSMKLLEKIKNRKELWIDLLMFVILATAIALLAVII